MTELEENGKAFSTFRVLNGDADSLERDQLFRNMAQLFSYVSERCDDDQVAQYDEVLCQLADLVETNARAHVAGILAPLDRAPGSVVVKLANDSIEVAAPLLEFSNVLSDDDLIDIVTHRTEGHRIRIAGRDTVGERIGDAIVSHGGSDSMVALLRNNTAIIGNATAMQLAKAAKSDPMVAADLRGRKDIDWQRISATVENATGKMVESMATTDENGNVVPMGKVNALVYNRMRSGAGFSAQEWKLAWNQIKALSDRRQLNQSALGRFARFGYGHHVAACLTQLMTVPPDVFVKWLATQDYVALSVAARAIGINPELFEASIWALPWRDAPTQNELSNARSRFEALGEDEARGIFDLWRAHAFRRKPATDQPARGAA